MLWKIMRVVKRQVLKILIIPVTEVKMRWLRGRLSPASRKWGVERGRAIDRIYVEDFFEKHKTDIVGSVMEIGCREYTERYGTGVSSSIVYDVMDGPGIDVVGDLTTGESLEEAQFDCVIVPQTLMMIHKIHDAVGTIFRILKPGGIAIVTVNFIAPNCDDPCQEMWQWNITPNAARQLFTDTFGSESVQVTPYGNYAVASSFLAGLADKDVRLDYWTHEVGYEVLVGVRAVKPDL